MVRKKKDKEGANEPDIEISDAELEKRFNELLGVVDDSAGQKDDQDNHEDGEFFLNEDEKEIDLSKFPPRVQKIIKQELKEMESASGSEQAKIKRYLDWVTELPWFPDKVPKMDIRLARAVLEQRHYGLSVVKEKILEFLAVQMLTGETYGTALLLVGPPGVGKTSFAKSIAEAMQRKFVKVSLGGVYDEALIHGFDRTYSGSQPGNIIRALRQAGTLNPVMLLDEIDKIGGRGNYGDVSAALLEVLDSDRSAFRDQYMDIPVDLSGVVFIATANEQPKISPVLLDRMQVIHIDGYSIDEKAAIAHQHILPKEEKRHGLKPGFVKIEDDALDIMIREYATEPGVRTLQHHVQSICSRIAYMVVSGRAERGVTVNRTMLPVFLGRAPRNTVFVKGKAEVGVANALGYVSEGRGTVCPVEVGVLPGDGKIQYTGNLRKILRESCEVAISLIRTRAADLTIKPDFYDTVDIHFHALQAGVPKDGPSMGVTLFTALFSALTNIPVQGDLAMTGEITLRGKIMPIGGLEEKLTAAYNAGISRVIVPEANCYDLNDIPDKIIKNMDITGVSDVDQLLEKALVKSYKKLS